MLAYIHDFYVVLVVPCEQSYGWGGGILLDAPVALAAEKKNDPRNKTYPMRSQLGGLNLSREAREITKDEADMFI